MYIETRERIEIVCYRAKAAQGTAGVCKRAIGCSELRNQEQRGCLLVSRYVMARPQRYRTPHAHPSRFLCNEREIVTRLYDLVRTKIGGVHKFDKSARCFIDG